MILKKCSKCNEYSLNEKCRKCESETKDAHYKFIHLKDVEDEI